MVAPMPAVLPVTSARFPDNPRFTCALYRTTLMLKLRVPKCFHTDDHNGRYPSVARAVTMSPRSITSVQPNACSSSRERGNGHYADVNGIKLYYEIHGSPDTR